ncbi:MAG: PQQ-binding-like beta-propeller repeat protein [Gemmatales bacterium]
MRPSLRSVVVLFILVVVAPQIGYADPPKNASSDWSMYDQNVAGWRFNAGEKSLSPLTVGKLEEKWSFPQAGSKETIGVVHATPTVVAGEVYFGTATEPAFYKLAPDGKLRWVYRNTVRRALLAPSKESPSEAEKLRSAAEGGIFGSALVADGSVYFADTGGMIYCLDAASGAERWKVDCRAPTFPNAHWNNLLMASPIMAGDKVVFAGGTLEHTLQAPQPTPAAPDVGLWSLLNRRRGNFSGSTMSDPSRRSSIRPSSSIPPGASTSSSMARHPAASGVRHRMMLRVICSTSAPM